MPPIPPKKPQTEITPRDLLAFNRLGTGSDINTTEYRAHLRQTGVRVANESREMIKNLTSFTPSELHELAPEATFSRSTKAERIRSRIRGQLIKNFSFFDKYKKDEKVAGMRELSRDADDYIKDIIEDYFQDEQAVKMNNEVETCHDVATLALMAYNDELSAKVKFEAARKLLLMKFFGRIRDYSEKEVDHEEALQYMMSIFNERIIKLPEGARQGDVFTKYLVSHHEGADFKASSAEIVGEKPTEANSEHGLTRVTNLICRRTILEDKSGNEREAFFSVEPRDKTSFSRMTKALRYGGKIGQRDLDRNGLRLVFSNRADWEDFFRMFKEELKSEIEGGLKEQLEHEMNRKQRKILESRLRSLDQSIIIHSVKDSLDGGGFKGKSSVSSNDLRVHKFDLEVTRADGKQHHYEFQVFLPDGYADSKYRKRVSWDEYDANRFFSGNVDELLFPVKVYPQVDHDKIHAKVMKQAHRKVWNGNVDSIFPPKKGHQKEGEDQK